MWLSSIRSCRIWDGLIVITKLKEIAPDIQTILLTGHGSDKLKEATEALNSAYFDKGEMGKFWEFLSNLPLGNVNILIVDDHEKISGYLEGSYPPQRL